MHWRLKAFAFRALAVPGGDAFHYLLQRHVTCTWPRPAAALDALSQRALRVVGAFSKMAGCAPDSVLEVGAGRDLAMALALRAAGAGRVIATDLNRLAKLDLVSRASERLLGRSVATWADLETLGVSYRAPHLPEISDGPVDCSCSNEVLEHVPADDLPRLLATLRTITTGVTVHSIDYSDHYARGDTVSRHNFLLYSDEAWRRYNPRRHYVNRLRHSDYLRLFEQSGFEIIEESSTASDLPAWVEVNRDARFRFYSRDDLLAIKGTIVARPKPP